MTGNVGPRDNGRAAGEIVVTIPLANGAAAWVVEFSDGQDSSCHLHVPHLGRAYPAYVVELPQARIRTYLGCVGLSDRGADDCFGCLSIVPSVAHQPETCWASDVAGLRPTLTLWDRLPVDPPHSNPHVPGL